MTNPTLASLAAEAIAQAGSPAHTVHAGATLRLMLDLARTGDLQAMSDTFTAHVTVHPGDRRSMADRVPAKILNQYFYLHCERSVQAVERWRAETPDWADTLRHAIGDSRRFAALAEGMARDIARAELG